jgi:myo-inositol-1(or 4)-monophosphatase
MLDGRRLRVSQARTLEGALIGTGIPFRANLRWKDAYLRMLGSVMDQAAGIRRPGAAALDLAYVAAGRFDGFFELGLAPWDTAAGVLLVQEAGGNVGTFTGKPYDDRGHLVAGSPRIQQALLELLRPHLPEELVD